ncbi:copper chaperone PCu(A)C [Parasphingopyxis marina]|uniref:Copper chaperone PCu(A)C n=1 Tax=Parasphingopyxis marina TaxID=2761622 RepID=A0A842I2X7_9SPHN|nr:copper chaperone PCu(A)C [Parasphingopyxis marina]MBC2778234.1 copper chaperone PCu(A)C [Parasphingopyxis marina]
MRYALLAGFAAIALSACSQGADEAPADPVENAWVRLPAVDGRPAAAYFTLHGGDAGDTLIAVDSERVASIELHETTMEGGAMRMRPIMSVDIPAGETIAFEPGGRHAMLFGVDPEVTAGTNLTLHFRFDSGRDVSIEAATIDAGDDAPAQESGQDHGAH